MTHDKNFRDTDMKNNNRFICFSLILLLILSAPLYLSAQSNPNLLSKLRVLTLSENPAREITENRRTGPYKPRILPGAENPAQKTAQTEGLVSDPGTQITFTGMWKDDLDWSPDGKWIVYSQGGDIYAMRPEGSVPTNLTRNIEGDCYLPWFSNTSAGITFTNYNVSTGIHTLEYISILGTGHEVISESMLSAAWSHNGRYLVYRSYDTSELIIYDNELGSLTNLGAGDYSYGSSCFSFTDKYVFTTILVNGFESRIVRIPVGGGEPQQISFGEGDHWKPESSPDGTWVMYTDLSANMLMALNTFSLTSTPVFDEAGVTVGRFSPDGTQFCYLREGDGANEVFITDFDTSSSETPLLFIEVVSPNGGETLTPGKPITIEWNSSGVAAVRIDYTTDGGTSWNVVAENINGGLGSFDWIVPELNSDRCRIRIASMTVSNFVADQSDGNFTIVKSNSSIEPVPQTGLVFKYPLTGEVVLSSPAVGEDGTVYIGSDDGNLYAVNPDGTKKWTYQTGGPIWSSPAIGENGVIYIGSDDGFLHAVNPNGTRKWRFHTDGPVQCSPAIGQNGIIYFGSYDNIFYAVNPVDGTERWQYEVGTIMVSSPAVGYDGTIYFGAIDGNLYALRANGSFEWTFPTGGEIYSSPAISEDGTVYIGSNDRNIYAVNPDGTKKWNRFLNNYPESSPVIGPDGIIYIGVQDNNLYAIDGYDGTVIWQFGTRDIIVSSPAVGADGTVYVGSADMNIYAVNSDGSLKWNFTTDGSIWSSPTLDDNGILYIGSRDWHLYAVDTETGQGMAESPWPKLRHDIRNTGKVFTESTSFLMVTFPDGGENLLPGTDVDITWSQTGVAAVNLRYSLNKGLSWNMIADGVSASLGKYRWTIPQGIDSSDCLVRVIDASDLTIRDASNNPFTISPGAYIELTSRIGGSKLGADDTYTITWESNGVSEIDITYSTDGGTTWKNMAIGVNADIGTYTWIVPADFSDNCKIMITDSADAGISASSIGAFSIQSNNFITVTSPKFGDRWTAQSTKQITWEFNGISNVKIEYSTDNGSSWQTITASVSAATGSYGWTVPDTEAGQCLIRVTDTANASLTDNSDRFEIIIPELIITHNPVTSSRENEPITFTANVESESEIESVTLYYDITGSRNFSAHEVAMESSDGTTYSITLDVGIFTAYGLEYYIQAKDESNQNTRSPADKGYYSISAVVSDIKSTETLTGGSAQNAYRMISVPLEIDSKYDTIEKQMGELLPEGESGTGWRLFRYAPGETTADEYPNIEPLTPGTAYWLISKSDFQFEAPPGTTVSTAEEYTITLKAGWNDIANPWMFDISWDDIENPSGAELSVLYMYDGSWSDPTSPPKTLEPWKGYAVNNMTNVNVVIKLNPNPSESIAKPAVGDGDIAWSMSVSAFAGKAKDTANHFGLRRGALDEWDRYDHLEPPSIGEYVSVSFPHEDWDRFPQAYTVDFRPSASENLSWDFAVKTNIPGEKVILTFDGIGTLPEGYGYTVIDRLNGTVVPVSDDTFSFISGSGASERLFTVAVGDDHSHDRYEHVTAHAEFLTARCYPNPFNPSTTIDYELPAAGRVHFTVFNSLGQAVRTNDLGMKQQGAHSFVFDATGMISGLYFYTLKCGDSSVTGKMVFMK